MARTRSLSTVLCWEALMLGWPGFRDGGLTVIVRGLPVTWSLDVPGSLSLAGPPGRGAQAPSETLPVEASPPGADRRGYVHAHSEARVIHLP